MEKVLIVDGNSILNRAFYGIRLLTNQNGLYTNAVYGMITILSRHLEELKPTYCAVAFDLKAPTFRHKMYEGYKANRKGMPEELAVQLPYAKECMTGMGLTVVTCEGYEADDILGTLATAMGAQNKQVYLLTGDRDSLQLIDEHVSVLLAKNKETVRMDSREFQNQYGIPPSLFVEVKALMGDSSDNIPGVAGIGEKTAFKLISEYRTLTNLYEQMETSELSDSMKNKLRTGKEMAFLSHTLSKIDCHVPISTEPEDYRYLGPDSSKLRELFLQLDFSALLKKFHLNDSSVVQQPKETRDTENKEPSCIAVAAATDLTGEFLCMDGSNEQFSIFDGTHLFTADSMDVLREAVKQLQQKKWVCYDAKRLYKQLQPNGIQISWFFDCMLAAYVLDSGRGSYSLSDLLVRYQSTALSEEEPTPIAVYRLYSVLKKEIENNHFESLLYDIEMPLTSVLAEMELRGFHIDCNGISAYGQALKQAADCLQERIYQYAGEEFNIGSPKQLGEILFEKMQLPKSRKTKTGYSTDAESLQKLSERHPIIEDILDYRQVTKLKSTYADGLVAAADSDGCVHSAFNQTGTATGRLSSSEPNLQNIPVRTELGRMFRQFFIPKNDDYVLIDADYSQIELRLLAHIAGDDAMIRSFASGEDIHAMTASKVFDVPLEQVTADLRKKAKAVNFGILYGIGEYSLSEDLHISRIKAKEYIDSYFAKFPQIHRYLEQIKEEAHANGFVTTLFGRRRYIPELASSNKNLQHFGERVAMNSPIQGTAADIMKLAMIRVYEELKKRRLDAELLLQVHDELLVEAHKDCAEEAKQILTDCMEQVVALSVPLSVEANIGNTWLTAK